MASKNHMQFEKSPEFGRQFNFSENIQITYNGQEGSIVSEIAVKMAERYEAKVIEQIAMEAKAAGVASVTVLNKAAILEALEKQLPQRPDLEADGYSDGELVYDTGYCPRCRQAYEIEYRTPKHCENCGQALDWSEIDV